MAREIDMTGTTLSNAAARRNRYHLWRLTASLRREGPPVHPTASDSHRRRQAISSSRRFRPARILGQHDRPYAAACDLGLIHVSRHHWRSNVAASRLARAIRQLWSPCRCSISKTTGSSPMEPSKRQPVTVTIAPTEPMTIPSPLQTTSVSQVDRSLSDLPQSGGVSATRSPLVRLPGGGLSGRSPEGRAEYGRKYGATIESEQAVDAALQWLAAHQRPNGSWSFNLELDPCSGSCANSKQSGETPTPSTGATGLALLAFLGAGHTHQGDGPYRESMRRGIYYLRDIAAESEAGYEWQQGSMYGHGIALMALGEALSMTTEAGDRRGQTCTTWSGAVPRSAA